MIPYKYDVFLSYARANNKAKWVTKFREALENVLTEIPDVGPVSVFHDVKDIEGSQPFDDSIRDGLATSAVLMIVVSEVSLTRDWCQREQDEFMQNAGGPEHLNRRVFLINYDGVDQRSLPEHFQKFNPYPFYDEDTSDKVKRPGKLVGGGRFHPSFYRLREDLISSFRALKSPAIQTAKTTNDSHESSENTTPETVEISSSSPSLTVYVADVNPGITETKQYDAVVSAIGQRARVVPLRTFIEASDGFEHEVHNYLNESDLFVQLLSPVQSRVWSYSDQGYEEWLFEQARTRGIRILRWCPRDENLGNLDVDYRKFLQEECPILGRPLVGELGEFIPAVFRELDRIQILKDICVGDPRRTRYDDSTYMVCVLVDNDDESLGDEIGIALEGMAACKNGRTLEPELIIAGSETDLQRVVESIEPRGLVVGWNQTDRGTVSKLMRDCRRYRSSCEIEPPQCAIIVPSKETHPISRRPPRFAVVAQDDQKGLQEFACKLCGD